MKLLRQIAAALLAALDAVAGGCGPHDPPIMWRGPAAQAGRDAPGSAFDASVPTQHDAASDVPVPDAGGAELTETCVPLTSSESMPALDAVSADGARAPDRAIFTRDVFALFKSNCGGCHVDPDPGRGGFGARDLSHFQTATRDRQQLILDRLRSDDPTRFMPPAGQPNSKPWSQRGEGDPVVELATLLEQWFAAGSPPDLFYVAAEHASAGGYLLPEEVANGLTNIGNCLPAAAIIGRATAEMDALDAFFAAATELPPRLDQTDLTTFDTETLARNGVIAFAPAYPLFSDHARKIRHVRLPRGEALQFDEAAQEFTVPANTRVYKTFFKRVIDANGNERYRKIETRLILSRPDGPDGADGSHETKALFGTYAWNDAETEALLVTDPLRNGKPFRDRLITYITDEKKAADVLATDPFNKVEALRAAGATRAYAIPGSERCLQCHMGSHNRSFVLGLTPLQLKRRAPGEGGIYEEPSEDELAQLGRLIDYGIIEGLESEDDILPLERSQGDRSPRNDYELAAQGYALGNCAHCHNPRGYPTIENPVLRDLLRFFPDRDGGLFQFPLERTSPRIKRGLAQDLEIAYITPSLFDAERDASGATYTQKYVQDDSGRSGHYLAAPWRSLIYRNVDTPFTFSEDYALYPRMPMNAPGFDCRAPRIFGNWMVSIPARLRDPTLNDVNPGEGINPPPQPYIEVEPGEPDYAGAAAEAEQRLAQYQKGGRAQSDLLGRGWTYTYLDSSRCGDYCPDETDIIDPDVGGTVLTPQDHSSLPSLAKELADDHESAQGKFAATGDGIPDHPHWVVTDITDSIESWYPRRSDWASVLVEQKLDGVDARQRKVIELLQNLKLSPAFRSYATTPTPFGLWARKDGCEFANVPRVTSLSGDARPAWLSVRKPSPAPDDPLYAQSPGEAVFRQICINCHGAKFDSRGRQADTLMLMTGGETRVANLRDGLLGPIGSPGANRAAVFDQYATTSVAAEDWAARYVSWMGLGGTQRVIPQAILNVVGAAQVLGEPRPNGYSATASSANMLAIAQSLCGQSLGRTEQGRVTFDVDHGAINHHLIGLGTALVPTNGDAELWTRLCGFENPPPVRVLLLTSSGFSLTYANNLDEGVSAWYDAASYPASAKIGDHRGRSANGVQPDNFAPWCIKPPADSATQAQLDELQAARPGNPLPVCPQDWLTDANKFGEERFERWAMRAAMNAGSAVFLYLDQLARDTKDGKGPQPAYDHCEELHP